MREQLTYYLPLASLMLPLKVFEGTCWDLCGQPREVRYTPSLSGDKRQEMHVSPFYHLQYCSVTQAVFLRRFQRAGASNLSFFVGAGV
jgi:hypothetical protein